MTKRELGFAQPAVRLRLVAEDPFRKLGHAREADRPVGFFHGQGLAALDATGESAPRHHQGKNFVL